MLPTLIIHRPACIHNQSISVTIQFLNQQETVTNVETLKACMILLCNQGRLDSKTIRQGLIAFALIERYLIHFEDNYRATFQNAERQLRREADLMNTTDTCKTATFANNMSPLKNPAGTLTSSPRNRKAGADNPLSNSQTAGGLPVYHGGKSVSNAT